MCPNLRRQDSDRVCSGLCHTVRQNGLSVCQHYPMTDQHRNPTPPLSLAQPWQPLPPVTLQLESHLWRAYLCGFTHVCFQVYLNLRGPSVTTPFLLLPLQFPCVCLFAQLVLCSLYRQHQPNPAAVLPDIEPVRNEGPTLQCENKLQLSMNNCITSTSLCQSNGNTYTRMRTHERTQTLT